MHSKMKIKMCSAHMLTALYRHRADLAIFHLVECHPDWLVHVLLDLWVIIER